LISFADYNFDGHPDIAISSSSGAYNFWQNIYIYNPQKQEYYLQTELSEIPNV
jgi:hypothetical protein